MLVTHATKNIRLCDKVAVMGRGGKLTYFGSPDDALTFFRVEDFDGIYNALDARPSSEWRAEFDRRSSRASVASKDTDAPGESAALPGQSQNGTAQKPATRRRRRALPQALVLTRRYVQLLVRDRQNLLLLLGQAPLLALAAVVLFQSGLFDRVGGRPADAVQMLFLMAIAVIWLGSIDAAREIVRERSVFERESAIGTRLSAYLASKALVLFGLIGLQTLIYVGVLFLFRPLDASTGAYVALTAILVLTGFVAVAMGLLISAAVRTEDQAVSFNPLALIPQLLFAGAIIPVAQMTGPVKALSAAVFAQWSLAGAGTSLDMNDRIAGDPAFARADRFGPDFFDVGEPTTILVLVGFLVLFMAATALVLARRVHR
jgi:hypothetical protein